MTVAPLWPRLGPAPIAVPLFAIPMMAIVPMTDSAPIAEFVSPMRLNATGWSMFMFLVCHPYDGDSPSDRSWFLGIGGDWKS